MSKTTSDPVTVNVAARLYNTNGDVEWTSLTLAFDDDDQGRGRQLDCRLLAVENDEVAGAIVAVDLASLQRALSLLTVDAEARADEEAEDDD